MNLELFIARRIAHNGSGNRPGVMVRIAVVAVALSVTVMILALAVIMGFKREITDRVTGFSAQVEVAHQRRVDRVGAGIAQRTARENDPLGRRGRTAHSLCREGGRGQDARCDSRRDAQGGGRRLRMVVFSGPSARGRVAPCRGFDSYQGDFDLPERCPGDGACARR